VITPHFDQRTVEIVRSNLNKVLGIASGETEPLSPRQSLPELLAPHLRTLLFDLDRIAGAGNKAQRGLAVFKSFVGEIDIGLDIEPESGAAESGDLEVDLPNLFVAVGEAAEERQFPLVPITFCRWDGANQRVTGTCGTH